MNNLDRLAELEEQGEFVHCHFALGSGKVLDFDRHKPRFAIPSKQQYHDTLREIIEAGDSRLALIVRMGCELGMSRLEIAFAEVDNIDRYHKRSIYIKVAKKVRRENDWKYRSREIPINIGLYSLLQASIDEDWKYIIKKYKTIQIPSPINPGYISAMYKQANIPWSSHKSRHYFKNCMMDWMRRNRSVDVQLVKTLMGHKLDVNESYGSISWDYKQEIVDKVFGTM